MTRLACLSLLAVTACASVPPPIAASPVAGFGQIASGSGLSVRPIALMEDSRCPATVQCVWAGQVRITAEVGDDGGRGSRELTLDQPLAVAGGTVTMIAVEPPKLAPGATVQAAYRFTFRFAR